MRSGLTWLATAVAPLVVKLELVIAVSLMSVLLQDEFPGLNGQKLRNNTLALTFPSMLNIIDVDDDHNPEGGLFLNPDESLLSTEVLPLVQSKANKET